MILNNLGNNALIVKYNNLPISVKASLWFTICNFIQKISFSQICFIILYAKTRIV